MRCNIYYFLHICSLKVAANLRRNTHSRIPTHPHTRPAGGIPGLWLTGQDVLTCGFAGALGGAMVPTPPPGTKHAYVGMVPIRFNAPSVPRAIHARGCSRQPVSFSGASRPLGLLKSTLFFGFSNFCNFNFFKLILFFLASEIHIFFCIPPNFSKVIRNLKFLPSNVFDPVTIVWGTRKN